jgi:hypothetical protein
MVPRSAEAHPEGDNRKKAIVLISDGNDTNSRASARDVAQVVRETEVLVYAIGIDGREEPTIWSQPRMPPRLPIPRPPFPLPGRGRPRTPWPFQQQRFPPFGGTGGGDALNVAALRDITDNSGGRTENVRDARDLDRATASITDELSKQYYLGYPSPGQRDGRWHAIVSKRAISRDASERGADISRRLDKALTATCHAEPRQPPKSR